MPSVSTRVSAIVRTFSLLSALAVSGIVFSQENKAEAAPEFDFGRGIYNTAKAKLVVASSDDSAGKHWAANATDGKSSTKWLSKPDAEFPQWLRMNVKRELDAKAVVIQWDTDIPQQYKIEASTDGIEWDEILDATGNDEGVLVVRHEVDTKSTQYFRLTITGSHRENAAGLREWAIYEDSKRIPKAVQDAANGIIPKPKPEPKPDPKPEPKPDPEKMTKVEPKPPIPESMPEPKLKSKPKTGPRPDPSSKIVTRKLIAPDSDDALLASVHVPEGYSATIFARPPLVSYPTFVKAAPTGEVFVSSDKNGSLGREVKRGKVQKLVDSDGDGVADEFHDFIPDLDSPRGLEWDGEWLYVVHPPFLTAYRDTDADNVADENRRLITNLGFGFRDRATDHTANGITLGIDGWLYIAVGDLGIYKAVGADETTLSHRGGCVVRVRPDGSRLHVFSHGVRNIYDLAVSPRLDVFARGNSNDGGGWGVRFHHFTGLENHGYPALFRHFPRDAVAPLSELKTGSGTGAAWLDEPGFPESETNVPLTADWERGMIYRHEIEAHGASFVEKAQHEFIGIPKPTDIEIATSGQLLVSSWTGGDFKYDSEAVGFIAQITPPKWKQPDVPKFKQMTNSELIALFHSDSHLTRLHAQQELLRRDTETVADLKKAFDEATGSAQQTNPIASFPALFAIAQMKEDAAFTELLSIAKSAKMPARAAAFRALGDRKKTTDNAIFNVLPNVTDPVLIREIIVAIDRTRTRESDLVRGILKHTANRDPLISHTAVEALVSLDAQRTSLSVLDDPARSSQWPGALRALSRLHSMSVVYGLKTRIETTTSSTIKRGGLRSLARLYHREGTWSGESWGNRPDVTGPHFNREPWGGSSTIGDYLQSVTKGKSAHKDLVVAEMGRNHIQLDNLSSLLKLLIDKREMEETAVNLILERSEPPPESLPFLTFIASATNYDGEMRLKAALSLAKSKDAMALDMAMETAAVDDKINASAATKKKLWDSLVNNSSLENRYSALIEHGFSPNESLAKFSWRVLAEWHKGDGCSPNMKAQIEDAFARAKADSKIAARLPDGV